MRNLFGKYLISARLWIAVLIGFAVEAQSQRIMEKLDRAVVAVKQEGPGVYVGWRMLGNEPDTVTYNVYRDGAKVNAGPIADSTNLIDTEGDENSTYTVRAIIDGTEQAASSPGKVWAQNYHAVPLTLPEGTRPNDASVGDLDGDGIYEIVLKSEQRPRDTASTGLTGETLLQGYKLDGTVLWTINLGKNIREGAHYTQFMVYDLDGDGIAEIACKTADGTVDGAGKVIGDPNADWRDTERGSRTYGRVLKGPEFFTIFDGRTGAELATADYIPGRGPLDGWGGIGGNGGNDNVGNRADRMLACVAYLDGTLPSVVMARGYYGRSVLAAWDWRDGKLTSRWVFDTHAPGTGKDGKPNLDYAGMGGHSVSVADVDADGKDEIVYHSMVVDDDGQGLFTTGLRHGDALHVGDFEPSRPGLEVFGIHENEGATVRFGTPATALFDARTGEILQADGPGADAGRGVIADIDPTFPGAEMWGGPGELRNIKGEEIGPRPRSQNFLVWWDGDLLRELLDRSGITKWNWETGEEDALFTPEGVTSNNGSKATPTLTADLFGDWREEVIWRTQDGSELRIYTTTIPTEHRFRTLMSDPQYRLAVAWQNVGYNQPPHPSFHLGPE